ncbi:MAG: (Fe-S)-binding protein [bacterium]
MTGHLPGWFPGGTPTNIITVLLFFGALGLFAFLVTRLVKILLLGTKENRFDRLPERVKDVIVFVLGQKRVVREPSGWGHFLIFWGFLLITVGTVEGFVKGVWPGFTYRTLLDPLHLGFLYLPLNLAIDLVSFCVLGALGIALYRRYVQKPVRLQSDDAHAKVDATIIISLILVLIVFMFLARGAEMNLAQYEEKPVIDPAGWAPVSFLVSLLLGGPVLADAEAFHSQQALYAAFWWIHNIIILAFLIYIPFSKHLHLLGAIPNIFFRSFRPKGEMTKMDLEDETVESYGVSKFQDYTWKQLLDEYACTECGRCQENCPAFLTQKPLSPSRLTHHLKLHVREKGGLLVSGKPEGLFTEAERAAMAKSLIGEVVSEDEIWDCTTCRACQENCPVFVEHIQKIIDLRRYLVLTESRFPPEVQSVFRNMETNYNPWSMGYSTRADWVGDLDVKTLGEVGETDYLFWVGCAGSFDDRAKKVTTSLVKILQAAKVSFAILGTEEMCCGETARRMGNEYLAQTLMQGNVDVMKNYKFNKILTLCPHCLNTLKAEYPQFGGNYEVVHHSQLIAELVRTGRLALKNGASLKGTLTYHDSCYLGRYNDIYEEPRQALSAVPGARLVEMDRIRHKSFCCGAGGGRMWMEETRGVRINEKRAEAAIACGASLIGTACPFCLTMFEDGVKAKGAEEKVEVVDIAELVARTL